MAAIEVSTSTENINGNNVDMTEVKYGDDTPRRSVQFRKTDIADSWDLLEIAPENAPRNWRLMALVAVSITKINGVPSRPMRTPLRREDVRERLQQLGDEGFAAVIEAQAPPATEAEMAEADDAEAAHRAHVGN